MFPHSKLICWNLTPSLVVFEGVAFERWLGHEGGMLRNGISEEHYVYHDYFYSWSMFSTKFLLLKPDAEYIVMFKFVLKTQKIKIFCLLYMYFSKNISCFWKQSLVPQ